MADLDDTTAFPKRAKYMLGELVSKFRSTKCPEDTFAKS